MTELPRAVLEHVPIAALVAPVQVESMVALMRERVDTGPDTVLDANVATRTTWWAVRERLAEKHIRIAASSAGPVV